MNPYEQAIEAINGEYGLLINNDVPFTRHVILEALKQASERLKVHYPTPPYTGEQG